MYFISASTRAPFERQMSRTSQKSSGKSLASIRTRLTSITASEYHSDLKPDLIDVSLKPDLIDVSLKPDLIDVYLKPHLIDVYLKPHLIDVNLKQDLIDVNLKRDLID